MRTVTYVSAGGVIAIGEWVLVLRRPSRNEVRLPKGHVEEGESLEEAALREAAEETGYAELEIVASLGQQVVEYDLKDEHVIRQEHCFLMRIGEPRDAGERRGRQGLGEKQFTPDWLSWEEATAQLSYEAEREWLRRAWEVQQKGAEPV